MMSTHQVVSTVAERFQQRAAFLLVSRLLPSIFAERCEHRDVHRLRQLTWAVRLVDLSNMSISLLIMQVKPATSSPDHIGELYLFRAICQGRSANSRSPAQRSCTMEFLHIYPTIFRLQTSRCKEVRIEHLNRSGIETRYMRIRYPELMITRHQNEGKLNSRTTMRHPRIIMYRHLEFSRPTLLVQLPLSQPHYWASSNLSPCITVYAGTSCQERR